ncbi:MAG: hypothetical protein CM1200mP22_11650 [Dehalococcoidia bacterium]|nr:MAG: hypothetical protein CM1200mP22_11650 [Dehalococcoidia bacterium]
MDAGVDIFRHYKRAVRCNVGHVPKRFEVHHWLLSVSHMGYVVMGIATLDNIGMAGAVLQMFAHGLMTALMFLLVGSIYHKTHTRDINVLNGLASRMPINTFFFAIAGLASLGLPGLSGFIAEFMVFTGTFRTTCP